RSRRASSAAGSTAAPRIVRFTWAGSISRQPARARSQPSAALRRTLWLSPSHGISFLVFGSRRRGRSFRYHHTLTNLTPGDVYLGRGPAVLSRREKVKLKTIEGRRRLHLLAANGSTQMDQILS